jgi:polyisoprenoid-binding protein YceI
MKFASRLSLSAIALASLMSTGAASAAAPAGNYKIDPVHSVAYFEVGHAGGISRFMGRFNDMSGDLVVDTPEKSKIRVDVKVDSVDTKNEGLDKHLKSPDFFNAVQFPTLSFVSSAVTLNGSGEGTVAGNLTLHGVTKPVTFKLKEIGAGNGPRGDSRVGYTASTTIKRSDFGIAYGIPKAATDDVDLRINIEAIKQ